MKKNMSIFLVDVFTALMVLTGCGISEHTSYVPTTNNEIDNPIVTQGAPVAEEDSTMTSTDATPEETPIYEDIQAEQPMSEVNQDEKQWHMVTVEWTDVDGYTFEATLRLSPFILLSNIDKLNSYWTNVTSQDTLPTINDWGLQKDSETHYRRGLGTFGQFSATLNDMYYSVGTIQVENKTDGWDFSNERPGYPKVEVICAELSGNTIVGGLSEVDNFMFATKIFYSNETLTENLGFQFRPIMTANKTSEVPIILMCAEYFSPQSPEGRNREMLAERIISIRPSLTLITEELVPGILD